LPLTISNIKNNKVRNVETNITQYINLNLDCLVTNKKTKPEIAKISSHLKNDLTTKLRLLADKEEINIIIRYDELRAQ